MLLLIALLAAATPTAAVVAAAAAPSFRLPTGQRPLEYAITLHIDPAKADYTGSEVIKVHVDAPQTVLWLHGRGLTVSAVKVAGQSAVYAQTDDDGLASITVPKPVRGDVEVSIAFSAKYGDTLDGIYKVDSEGQPYVFTQFEAIAARQGFPCFDEPGFKTPFSMSLVVPSALVAVANGSEVKRTVQNDGTTRFDFQTTQPLPVYLVAFAVGALDIVSGVTLPKNALRKTALPIRGVTTKGHGKQMAHSLDVAAKALVALENWFGTGYPFGKMDIVAVPDFAAGAMENAGLVTYRDALMFVDDNSPLGQQKANVFVISHEFAHQWFGDLVTLAWWDDIWLNEAFASWMETPIVEAIRPDFFATTAQRSSLDQVTGEDSLVSARQIRQAVLSKGDIINAFDGITYDKGASVIEMFAAYMGKDKFQAGVRAYMKKHAFGSTTAADLLAALDAAAGKDIATPFCTFLDQPGVPFVEANCSAGTLSLKQSRFLPVGSTGDRNKTWQIPVCAGDKCTLLTSTTATLAVGTCPVHPNSDGRGYYRWALPAAQMRALPTTMTAGERISFANAVRAAFSAAALPFAAVLEAAAPLARDAEPSVARAPLSLLSFALDYLVLPGARARVQANIVELYRPVLDKVGLEPKDGEDARVRELRTLALSAIVDDAEDPTTRALLAKRGRAVLGLDSDHKLHLDLVQADLRRAAISAAVLDGGPSAWDATNLLLSSTNDSVARGYLLNALSRVRSPALLGKALALSLDQRLKVNEVLIPLYNQAGDALTRDGAWAWFAAHYDTVIARLPEDYVGDRVVGLFDGFCSEDKAQTIATFYAQKVAKNAGMQRGLAIALENIRLCSAKSAAHQDSARKLFAL